MTYKLLVAAALSLGLGTAIAVAQTDTIEPEAGAVPDAAVGSELPAGWDGAIGDAFFADPELGTLRSEEEVRANWEALSEEQQAQVRSHCDTFDTAAADTLDDPAGAEVDEGTTASTTPDGAAHTASVEQVCGWIDTM